MKASLVSTIFSCALFLVNSACCKTYTGYKIYEIKPKTYEEADFLKAFSSTADFDVWKESGKLGEPTDIMVSPEDQLYFEKELTKNGLNFDIVVADVESIIQKDKVQRSLFSSRIGLGDVTFTHFMLYHEQMAYLQRLNQSYPDVTVETIGQSYEGRDILLLRISSGPSQTTTPKPVIFIDAGIHSREWIAHPVALYIIQQLVENSTNTEFYQDIDWAIVPNLNPDGYEYTQREDRLWRKNRRLTEGQACYGTDLNRNFDYFWMYDGASNDSCTQVYAGPEGFSEPETQALSNWLLQNGQNVKLYLNIHSYGEWLLYPWGYNRSLPDNVEELHSLGERVALAIEQASTMGSSYVVNTAAIGLYPAAGCAADWVKAVVGVELSYIIELPAGDAPYWFMIPARQILPVVQETWEGVKELHSYIQEKFVTNVTDISQDSS